MADIESTMEAPAETGVGDGYGGWLDEQFAMATSGTRWDWLVLKGFDAPANKNGEAGADPAIWRKMLSSPDTLRQRVTLALSEILVASVSGFSGGWKAFSAAAYLDLLEANAFGNYQGRLLQTTSIEQLAATLGSWLGVSDSDLLGLLPGLVNYNAAMRKLGFV